MRKSLRGETKRFKRHTHERDIPDRGNGLDLAVLLWPDRDVGNVVLQVDVFFKEVCDFTRAAASLDEGEEDDADGARVLSR